MNKNKRHGATAEKAFDHFCSPHAICNSPDQDEHGWDRMLEIPRSSISSDLGAKDFVQRVFVQIKYTSTSSRSVKIKLSNMERSCHEDKPWFIFFAQADLASKRERYFIRHVWGDLFTDTLKECRLKAAAKRPLHKSTLTVSFSDDHEVTPETIVKAILDTIDSVGVDYSLTKKRMYENLGYEKGRGVLSIRFETLQREALLREMLGVGGGLKASSFAFTTMRFGIPDPTPFLIGEAGNVQISPATLTKCNLTIQGPISESPLDLPGQLYGADLPGLTDGKIVFRVSAPPVELVCVDGENVSFSMKLDREESLSLQYFSSYSKICRWGSKSGINIRVNVGNKILFDYLSSIDRPQASNGAIGLEITTDALLSVLNHRGIQDFRCSIDDLNQSEQDLLEFAGLTKSSPLEIKFKNNSEVPTEIDSILYFVSVAVSNKIVQTIMKRPSVSDETDGEWRIIAFGNPTIIRGYYSEGDIESAVTEVLHDIRRLNDELSALERPFTLETEMITMVRSMTRVNKQPHMTTYQAAAHAIRPLFRPRRD